MKNYDDLIKKCLDYNYCDPRFCSFDHGTEDRFGRHCPLCKEMWAKWSELSWNYFWLLASVPKIERRHLQSNFDDWWNEEGRFEVADLSANLFGPPTPIAIRRRQMFY